MRWEGPQCACGHPQDAHWPNGRIPFDAPACRVRGCGCMAFSPALSKPSSHAEKVLDTLAQAGRREGDMTPERPVREADHQQAIIDLAKLRGWLVYHTHDSRRSAPGFPDLVLVRGKRILYREIKVGSRKPTPEQIRWIDALQAAGQDAKVWTMPGAWDEIMETLA